MHPSWQAERPVRRGRRSDPRRGRGAERRGSARSALWPTPASVCAAREPTWGAVGLPRADAHRPRPRLRSSTRVGLATSGRWLITEPWSGARRIPAQPEGTSEERTRFPHPTCSTLTSPAVSNCAARRARDAPTGAVGSLVSLLASRRAAGRRGLGTRYRIDGARVKGGVPRRGAASGGGRFLVGA
jgi:hypothetical protein